MRTRSRRVVFGAPGRRIFGLEIHDDADAMLPDRAIRLYPRRMRAQQVVGRDGRFENIAVTGREHPMQVPAVGDHPRFIQRRPDRHPVVQLAEDCRCVVGEPACDVGIEPATAIVERRGQVPVEQRHRRCDPMRKQRVDEPVVIPEPLCVDLPAALGQHATPRHAEAVRVHAERSHQRGVVGVAAILVAGHIPGIAVAHEARRAREALPDARPGAIGERRALDLVGRRRAAPEKCFRKFDAAFASRRHVENGDLAVNENVLIARAAVRPWPRARRCAIRRR